MYIRDIREHDLPIIDGLRKEHCPNDAMPDFNTFESAVAVVDKEDKIITAGGVQLVAEGLTITDKNYPLHARGKALRMLMQSMLLTCGRVDQDFLTVNVTDDDWGWMRALEHDGFKPTGQRQFYIEV